MEPGTAVTIDLRSYEVLSRKLAPALHNVLGVLPRRWKVWWIHGPDTEPVHELINSSALLRSSKEQRRLITRPAPKSVVRAMEQANEAKRSRASAARFGDSHRASTYWYNEFLASPHLWSRLKTPHVLLFESDARLCPQPSLSMAAFAAFEFVGAPWSKPLCKAHRSTTCVGNSGLSLWRREAMLNLTRNPLWSFASDGPQAHIDIWVSQQLQRIPNSLPSSEVASLFSVETLYPGANYTPVGVHNPFVWLDTHSARELVRRCPPAGGLVRSPTTAVDRTARGASGAGESKTNEEVTVVPNSDASDSGPPAWQRQIRSGLRITFALQYFLNHAVLSYIDRFVGCADAFRLQWHLVVHEDDGDQAHAAAWHRNLRKYGRNATFIFSQNVHEMRGFNMGARIRDADIVIFLQDDEMPMPLPDCQWLGRTVAAFERDERLGAVGLRRAAPSGDWDIEVRKYGRPALGKSDLCDPLLKAPARYAIAVDTGPLAVRRSAFLQVGEFPTFLTPPGQPGHGVDTLMCIHLWRAGWSVLHLPHSFERLVSRTEDGDTRSNSDAQKSYDQYRVTNRYIKQVHLYNATDPWKNDTLQRMARLNQQLVRCA